MKKFKVGDKVRLKKSSKFYEQSKGNVGVIEHTHSIWGHSDWVRIKWSHGYKNDYLREDLILASKKSDARYIAVATRDKQAVIQEFETPAEIRSWLKEAVGDSTIDLSSVRVFRIDHELAVYPSFQVRKKAA